MRPVTPLQREILVTLHCGWHWGADDRSLRGLRTRGLVVMRLHGWFCTIRREPVFVDLPWLTPAGLRVARECWLAEPLAKKEAHRAEYAKLGLQLGEHCPRRALA